MATPRSGNGHLIVTTNLLLVFQTARKFCATQDNVTLVIRTALNLGLLSLSLAIAEFSSLLEELLLWQVVHLILVKSSIIA